MSSRLNHMRGQGLVGPGQTASVRNTTHLAGHSTKADRLALVRFVAACLCAWPAALLNAAPGFLGLAGQVEEPLPLLVLAGRKAEMALTLTAGDPLTPVLGLDLFVAAGPLAAPLVKDLRPELHRVEPAGDGVQRFTFSVEIPAGEKARQFVMRPRVQVVADGPWLPLPPVSLEAMPASWKEQFRAFSSVLPTGRLAGSERLDHFFQTAGIEQVSATREEMPVPGTVKVWFAEASDETFQPPAGTTAALWIVFKPQPRVDLKVVRPGPGQPLCLVVDPRALRAEDDAAAQDLFERVLATAATLSGVSFSPP